jgi:hypothetical protein
MAGKIRHYEHVTGLKAEVEKIDCSAETFIGTHVEVRVNTHWCKCADYKHAVEWLERKYGEGWYRLKYA